MNCLSCNEEFMAVRFKGEPVSLICDKCQGGETVIISIKRLSLLAGEFFNDHSPNIAGEPCGCELCLLRDKYAGLEYESEGWLSKSNEARAELADARGQVCRAREALAKKGMPDWSRLLGVEKALSSPSPFSHAERAKELEAELDATIVTGRKREERIAALEVERLKVRQAYERIEKECDRLKEAVEWACSYGYLQLPDDPYSYDHDGFENELRRRAEGGK